MLSSANFPSFTSVKFRLSLLPLVLFTIKHFRHFPSRISITSVALDQGFGSDGEFNLPSLPRVEKTVFSRKTQAC